MNKALSRRLAEYRDEYAELWRSMQIRSDRIAVVRQTAARIIANRDRYLAVEEKTGVPWWFIGIVHKMECNLDFDKHLHNGDPLDARTIRVPRGRPRFGSPPFEWEDSAIDALRYDGVHKVKRWSIEVAALMFEKYNGFGYHYRGIPSPYLWSYSHAYVRGKFERDGVYKASLVSRQSGAMVILKVLMDMDSTIELPVSHGPESVALDESEILPPAKQKPLTQSRTLWGALLAFFSGMLAWIADSVKAAVETLTSLAGDVSEISSGITGPLVSIATTVGANASRIAIVGLVIGCFLAVYARIDDRRNGRS